MYARAIRERGQYRAEKIEEISDKVLTGEYDPQAARVAMDGLKWTAAKLDNTKYGDKLDLGNADGKPFAVTLVKEFIEK